jgi:hypothetical protein
LFRKLEPAPSYDPDSQLAPLAESMRDQAAETGTGWGGEVVAGADNPAIPAGYTYFGQFVDHDITFDPVSSLQRVNDPDALVDFRSPRFDLDSLYGSGPQDEPFQYDRETDNVKFLIRPNSQGMEDLPRNLQGTAVIGDPRNDENVIVSQLQLVFLKLHNKFVDQLAASGLPADQLFSEAQKQTRWHYQWVVVNDYLRRICGDTIVDARFERELTTDEAEAAGPEDEVADVDTESAITLKHYRPRNNPYMPVEFSVAAFRFGHSQIRVAYHLNEIVQNVPIFLPGDVGPLDDLRGGRELPGSWNIDWARFFVINGSTPQPSRLIDTKLSAGLFTLPNSPAPLALRNLLRGQALSLPSGQAVATALGLPALSGAELGGVLDPTPLWFYILKESELAGGLQLGSVGATIVAEVLMGLLKADPSSFINLEPRWRPTVGDGDLDLAELIVFATA